MAEAVVSAVVQTLAQTLADAFVKEAKFLRGVDKQADLLVQELNHMQGFLKDADEKQADSEEVRRWVSDTRRLAYQAEDLLERYAFKIQSRRGRGIIKRCIHFLDEVVTRHQVGSDIEALKAKISGLTTSFRDYGIREVMEKDESSSSSSRLQLRRSYSHAVEEDLVGLESRVETLVGKLVGENHRLVSIWGMGGLGKTTLARQVYYHPNVRCNFKALCWVCVSQEWNKMDLLKQILFGFMPEKKESIKNESNDVELVRQLFEFQRSTKCFVVLDDIWSLDAWKSIEVAFQIRENGNKVLLTTRNKEIATCIDPDGFHYQPSLLNEDESWELLKKKSRIERHHQEIDEEFKRKERLGKQMIKHCQGLPLGILLLGGILSRKQNSAEWEQVHNNIKSYLGKEDKITTNEIRIEDIFSLSYNDLPSQLKPCFLYLSKYKEDDDIKVEPLYQIWMAEGLIFKEDQMEDEPMMDVAERYLDELAKRCMVSVEVENDDVPHPSLFKSCRLHDIMREQCKVKAEKENFIELLGFGGGNSSVPLDLPSITSPRVAIASVGNLEVDEQHIQHVFSQKEAIRNLRSFFTSSFLVGTLDPLFGNSLQLKSRLESLLHDFRVLRVLSIEGLVFKGILCGLIELALKHGNGGEADGLRLPSAIGKLIHLRYLSFKGSSLHNIPSFIGNLEHLQTLDLRCSIGDKGKLKIGLLRRLKRLRHLYLNFDGYNGSKLSLDSLVSLEILQGFSNKSVDNVGVISSLKNLVSLTATIFEKVEDVDAFVNHVSKLMNIGRLRFLSLQVNHCDFNGDERGGSLVLKHLFLCKLLKKLELYYSKISRLPEWSVGINFHTLRLVGTRMEEDPMRTLEKLPNLRCLYLSYKSYEGEEMTCHADGFPQLKELQLFKLEHLKEWRVEEGAMPNLSSMEFYSCKKMKMIPDGFRHLKSLEELTISGMSEEFKNRVQIDHQGGQVQGGEDLDKICHVPSVIVR